MAGTMYCQVAILCFNRYNYMGGENVLQYRLLTGDSALYVDCSIKSYINQPEAKPEMAGLFYFQKKEIEFGKKAKILKELISDVDSVQVGFLKYMNKQDEEHAEYESRIFFWRGEYLVKIRLLELVKPIGLGTNSLADCIRDEIRFE
ncbi:hypothetical protein [Filimonas effusa]|uniref:Uncharacterized protein n=1 Tax=Filimonas effusa TaxID=2508721 RepID=A0A4Q1DBE5_9BACT|nr:hypothetical protein [Filimonas effusa]RXK86630.1 hypothetical protein ESB13_07450 [Filimonas effusa]